MKRMWVVLCLLTLMVSYDSDSEAVIKIGMLAQRGPEIALKEWGGIAQYLSGQLGDEVQIVPLNFREVLNFCWNEPRGFLFANSWFYVRARVLRGAKALVTVKYRGASPWFGGVIFVKADSPLNSLADLRQKRYMCVKYSSAGGWLFAKGVLVQEAGIWPEKDFSELSEGRTHDAVVYAIRDGKADVGTVRTNILETLQREGKIDMQQFRVIHPVKHPDFNEVCSTPLYPDWPVASLRDTPPELANKMRDAFLSIPQGHPALEQARKIDRFVPALDYGPLEELLKFLQVTPFKRSKSGK